MKSLVPRLFREKPFLWFVCLYVVVVCLYAVGGYLMVTGSSQPPDRTTGPCREVE